MFHTPTVNVIAASGMLSTHPPTPIRRVEDGRVLSPTCTRQRIESRRVKKQMMERVRRARISDKIAQLHGLALSMVGVDAEASVRTEKVEMLGFCHEVLSSLHSLLVERPDMMERLKACHRGGSVTSAVCRNITCDSPTTSRSGCRESGVYVP
ncbi:unnamed protein product [Taenia asiatica]|uniref:BHLH domain-containing protein n=1 Tax=Taenia asiatica TaxID=60517 RepID=A0A0R3WF75_TAEAS|nr:unnamed protein product [Taenia asiatica]